MTARIASLEAENHNRGGADRDDGDGGPGNGPQRPPCTVVVGSGKDCHQF